jgi:MFS family permease
VASQLVTRLGTRPVLVSGMVLVAGALLWFSQISVSGSYVGDILFPSVLAGFGLGLAFVPVTIGSQEGVRAHDAGLASGLINTSQQVGGALGLAILSTIATSQTNHLMTSAHGARSALHGALVGGFHDAFLVGAGFALAGLALAVALIRPGSELEEAVGAPVQEAVPAGVGS